MGPPCGVKVVDKFNRFDSRDRDSQTDRQTDNRAIAYALVYDSPRGKNIKGDDICSCCLKL